MEECRAQLGRRWLRKSLHSTATVWFLGGEGKEQITLALGDKLGIATCGPRAPIDRAATGFTGGWLAIVPRRWWWTRWLFVTESRLRPAAAAAERPRKLVPKNTRNIQIIRLFTFMLPASTGTDLNYQLKTNLAYTPLGNLLDFANISATTAIIQYS